MKVISLFVAFQSPLVVCGLVLLAQSSIYHRCCAISFNSLLILMIFGTCDIFRRAHLSSREYGWWEYRLICLTRHEINAGACGNHQLTVWELWIIANFNTRNHFPRINIVHEAHTWTCCLYCSSLSALHVGFFWQLHNWCKIDLNIESRMYNVL
jgi:hypothetical protein